MYIPLPSRIFKLKCKGPDLKLIDLIQGKCTKEELEKSYEKYQKDLDEMNQQLRRLNPCEFKGLQP